MGRPATQHEVKKEEIVLAAIECFSRYGFEGTTNKLIAAEAGLNSASLIYHYFPSKTDLFIACLFSFQELDDFKADLERNHDQPPEQYLLFLAGKYLQILRDPRLSKIIPLFIGTLQSHRELIPYLVERIEAVLWQPLNTYLQQKIAEGVLIPLAASSALQIFLGPMLIRMLSPQFLGLSSIRDEESDEAFVRNLVTIFLNGARKTA